MHQQEPGGRRGRGWLAGPLAAILVAAATTAPATATSPPPPRWIHIAAGWDFTCGIREGNTLWCWGDNGSASGELGHGPGADASLPQQITRPTAGWTSVTAGLSHACATRNDGTLWCWGTNDDGELGTGSAASPGRPQPVTTPAATGWASVTVGEDATCAVRTDSTLWCWGYNGDGQLGIGSTASHDLPQQVTSPAAAGWARAAPGLGSLDTCALRTDSTLWCWGGNDYGQLGTGGTASQALPHQVTTPAAQGWAGIGAGDYHTCAVRIDTTLWCWGANSAGELGLGSTGDQDLPQEVNTPASADWTSVAAADSSHTCALRIHALWCWGDDTAGDAGIGRTSQQNRPRRVMVPARTAWSLVAAGGVHTCAVRTGHALWCWGWNRYGQLGLGGTTSQFLPRQVTG